MAESGTTAKPSIEIDVDTVPFLYESCLRCTYRHAMGLDVQTIPVDDAVASYKQSPLIVESRTKGKWIGLHDTRFKILDLEVKAASLGDDFPLARVSYIGTIDALLETADGRIVLAKLVQAYQETHPVRRYERELAALSYALERPAVESETKIRVNGHALIGFTEQRVPRGKKIETELVPVEWIELERHTDRFLSFMRVITRLLTNADEPPATPGCARCRAARVNAAS